MRKRPVVLACVFALCAAAISTKAFADGRPISIAKSATAPARPAATPISHLLVPSDQWKAYRERFILPEGRLVDFDSGGVSHSEGQGYGMLLAVMADDRETFDRLWRWTALNLFVRKDNLAAWRWNPGDEPHIRDTNNATDGDLLIAWALARAARVWRSPEYRAAARRISLAVAKLIDASQPATPLLPPASFGFSRGQMPDGPVINLSYLVFPAFDELKSVAPEVDWTGLLKGSAALVEKSRFGPENLPADWVSVASGQPVPAQFQPAVFGYESIRIPLYLAWSSAGNPKSLSAFAASWQGHKGDDPGVIDLASGHMKQSFGDSGYRGVVALARCASTGEAFPEAATHVDLGRYFSATLHMLSLAAAREKFPSCLAAPSATAQR